MQLTSELAPRLTGLGVFSERATRDHTGSPLREEIPRRAYGGRLEEVQGQSGITAWAWPRIVNILVRELVLSKMATVDNREGQDDPESEDEVYEVVDLTEYARRHQWWSRVFGNNSGPIAEKYSVATQIAMGGVTGWCAGYVFQRVGKIAATAVGGGFLLLQIANHSGYVQVDWKKVEKDVNKAKKHLKKRADKAVPEINTFIEEVKATDFIKRNIVMSSGFVGGFFLGLAS
ncbi:FUN14 domain-containing protein 1 isoform X2 [Platichthys flesus]|uniref:FUN14 domain-containing protein 1 isoform X2 n=2 Tax=Pleuronectidae TaxID=8256 RepID=UPI002DBCDAA8|nr:FUN14 domain-containing protein 1 isoform X2 [Platichthys flesus]